MRTAHIFILLLIALMMIGTASANPNPFAKYTFDTIDDVTVIDVMGNHNGTLTGNATWESTNGFMGSGAINFTNGGSISIPHSSDFNFYNQDFSILMWIHPNIDYNEIEAAQLLIRKRLATFHSNGWFFWIERYGGNAVSLSMADGTTRVQRLSNGLEWDIEPYWLSVVYTSEGKNVKYYRNGMLIGNSTFANTFTLDITANNTQPVIIGDGFKGLIDEVSVYHVALTEEEIAWETSNQNMQSEFWIDVINGNDIIGDGTFESPFQSFVPIWQYPNPQHIYLKDGVYSQIIVPKNDLVIEGYGSNVVFDGIGTSGQTAISISGKDNVTIDNIKILNYNTGIRLSNEASNIKILGVTIDGMGVASDLIEMSSRTNNVLIENSLLGNTTEHGIHLYNQYQTGLIHNITINNTEIYDCGHNNIDIHTNVHDVNILNSKLYRSPIGGFEDFAISIHNGNVKNVYVYNTSIWGIKDPLAIYDADNVVFDNCDIKTPGAYNIGHYSEQRRIMLISSTADIEPESGLGATNVIFRNTDFEHTDVNHLTWIATVTRLSTNDPAYHQITFDNCTFKGYDKTIHTTNNPEYDINFISTVTPEQTNFKVSTFIETWGWKWYKNNDLVKEQSSIATTYTDETLVYNDVIRVESNLTGNRSLIWEWTVLAPDPETPTFAVTTFIVSSFVAASLTVTSYVNRRRK